MSQRPRHLIAVLADGDNTTWSGDAFVFSINDAQMARLMEDDKLARKWSDTRGELVSNTLQEMVKLQGELAVMEYERDQWRERALSPCDEIRLAQIPEYEQEIRRLRAALETAERDTEARIVEDLRAAADLMDTNIWSSFATHNAAIRQALKRCANRYERGDHRKGADDGE